VTSRRKRAVAANVGFRESKCGPGTARIAAAAEAGCDTLLSAAMPDGLVVETTLRILNPFRMAA
jgi:hypothetical protein